MGQGCLSKQFKKEFIKNSVQANRMLIRVVAICCVLIEFFNILRVLVFTNARLGTLNNRIYFGFYTFLFLWSVLFLVLEFGVKLPVEKRYNSDLIGCCVFLFWQTAFNMYDIYHSHAVGNITITTAMVAFAALLVVRPAYALCNLSVNYLIFAVFLSHEMSSGEVINFTITYLLCIVIYLVCHRHRCLEIKQKQTITEMHRALVATNQKFRLTREQHELICKRGSYIVFEWNIETDWIRFSEEWGEWFGRENEMQHLTEFVENSHDLTPEQKAEILQCMENIRVGVHYQKHELLLSLKTGEKRWFELHFVTQTDALGKPTFGIGMISDIMDQKERVAQLEQEIQMDSFTGTLNRTAIESYGERKLQELQAGERIIMLILDMDDFKNINDRFGHPVGDYVLQRVAALMREKAPAGTRVGRLGGDEFIALLKTDNAQALHTYGEELVREVRGIFWKNTDVGSSCSIGIAATDPQAERWAYADLYTAADHALYEAKRAGKQRLYSSVTV